MKRDPASRVLAIVAAMPFGVIGFLLGASSVENGPGGTRGSTGALATRASGRDAVSSRKQREQLEALRALGYTSGSLDAPERFGVTPDIITTAKGLTNGVIPMGAVLVRDKIYDAFMNGPEFMIELFHGYTYSGHPVAAAAGLAALDVYEEENIFEQAASLESHFEDLLHSFDNHKHVIDVRNIGLMGAIEMAPREGAVGARGSEVFKKCFWEENLAVRAGMDTLSFSPFLNSDPDEMQQSFEGIRRVLDAID